MTTHKILSSKLAGGARNMLRRIAPRNAGLPGNGSMVVTSEFSQQAWSVRWNGHGFDVVEIGDISNQCDGDNFVPAESICEAMCRCLQPAGLAA